jgi:hypothetical protein
MLVPHRLCSNISYINAFVLHICIVSFTFYWFECATSVIGSVAVEFAREYEELN